MKFKEINGVVLRKKEKKGGEGDRCIYCKIVDYDGYSRGMTWTPMRTDTTLFSVTLSTQD